KHKSRISEIFAPPCNLTKSFSIKSRKKTPRLRSNQQSIRKFYRGVWFSAFTLPAISPARAVNYLDRREKSYENEWYGLGHRPGIDDRNAAGNACCRLGWHSRSKSAGEGQLPARRAVYAR